MCSIDLEPCAVWQETWRTARKGHRCSCCGGAIQPRERYLVHFSVYDGAASNEKCCAACDAAMAEFASEHDSMRCVPSALADMLRECIGMDGDAMDEKWRALLDGIASRRVEQAEAHTPGSEGGGR